LFSDQCRFRSGILIVWIGSAINEAGQIATIAILPTMRLVNRNDGGARKLAADKLKGNLPTEILAITLDICSGFRVNKTSY
jgi:hypothetical protein